MLTLRLVSTMKLVEMGESVFLAECIVCHGINADGIDGQSANLNQRLELKVVKNVIENGSNEHLLGMEMPMPDRNGLMNANNDYAPITDAEIDAVATYVANGMTGAGADVFAGTCVMCHGADGKGVDGMGPNIREFTPTLVTMMVWVQILESLLLHLLLMFLIMVKKVLLVECQRLIDLTRSKKKLLVHISIV